MSELDDVLTVLEAAGDELALATIAGFLRDRGGPIHPRAAMESVG